MGIAAYVKTVWVSGAVPAIDKATLDNIEDQVFDLTEDHNLLDTAVDALEFESWFSFPTGDVVAEVGTHPLYAEEDRTIVKIQCFVTTAPTGAALVADVNKDDVTLFTNQAAPDDRPTIAISAKTSTTTIPSITAWGAGTFLTVDIDIIGSTIAGAGFTLKVIWTKD